MGKLKWAENESISLWKNTVLNVNVLWGRTCRRYRSSSRCALSLCVQSNNVHFDAIKTCSKENEEVFFSPWTHFWSKMVHWSCLYSWSEWSWLHTTATFQTHRLWPLFYLWPKDTEKYRPGPEHGHETGQREPAKQLERRTKMAVEVAMIGDGLKGDERKGKMMLCCSAVKASTVLRINQERNLTKTWTDVIRDGVRGLKYDLASEIKRQNPRLAEEVAQTRLKIVVEPVCRFEVKDGRRALLCWPWLASTWLTSPKEVCFTVQVGALLDLEPCESLVMY